MVGLPPSSIVQELAAVVVLDDFETTDVQPLFELVIEVVLDGVKGEGLIGRAVGADGVRRSASLPKRETADGAIVNDRRGVGMRVSMRRISCTLRCGSWSTICASIL